MKRTSWFASLLAGAVLAVTATAQPSLQTVITNGLAEPYGVTVDARNNYYVTDSVNNRIVRYNPDSGSVTNFAGVPGEAGNNNGPGVLAHFFSPQGIVATRDGLAVADSGNHRIRFIALDGTVSALAGSTLGFSDGAGATAQFNAPAGLAADAAGNIYVADMLNNRIRRIDLANNVTTVATGFLRPESVAVDRATGEIYVADTGNHSIKVIRPDGSVSLVAGSGNPFISGARNSLIATQALFTTPRAVLWVGGRTGLIVSDTGNRLLRRAYFNTNAAINNFSVETYINSESLGAPVGLALDDNGNFPLADLANHSLLLVRVTAPQAPVADPEIGVVILTTNSFGQLRTALVPVKDGTFNNDVTVAALTERGSKTSFNLDPEANFPEDPTTLGTVPFYENGKLEWTHTLITAADDGPIATIRAISTADGRKPSAIVTATFRFEAAGTVINGKNPGSFTMENATEGSEIWYTTDGSTPTNAAPSRLYTLESKLNIVDGTNDVLFKVGAFKPGYTPSFVEKTFFFRDLQTSSIGITRNFNAGIGATIIVPIEVKLANEDELQSLQFRVEITPSAGAPSISTQFRNLPISTNDFISIPVPSTNAPLTSVYTNGTTTGLALSYIGISSGLDLQGSATVALMAVPIPPNAAVGQTYTMSLLEPSATSDGLQASVALTPFSNRTITITNISYVAGDSALGGFYNAGDFGDRNLSIGDVDNAFHASLGLFTPYPFTDVFDAMDVFPEDSAASVGGDGQIRFLDWQIIRLRSLRLATNNWSRSWSAGGVRTASTTTLNRAPATAGESVQAPPPGAVWVRHAVVRALAIERAEPGSLVNVPVHVSVDAGASVSGLQFLATVLPARNAPPIAGPTRFVRAEGIPSGRSVDLTAANQTGYAWDVGSFDPGLQGQRLLGHVQFTVPANAQTGDQYRVRFSSADGAPNLNTQYTFETFPAGVFVRSQAEGTEEIISDEWKIKFFGRIDAALANATADADSDGVPNWKEYLAGTNPVKANSRLHLQAPEFRGARKELALRFLSAPGKSYIVEATSDIASGLWTAVASGILGDGNLKEIVAAQSAQGTQYFRVRLQD